MELKWKVKTFLNFVWLICGWGAPSWALLKTIEAYLASQAKQVKFAITINKSNIAENEDFADWSTSSQNQEWVEPLNLCNDDENEGEEEADEDSSKSNLKLDDSMNPVDEQPVKEIDDTKFNLF